jgi:hypothetical protein
MRRLIYFLMLCGSGAHAQGYVPDLGMCTPLYSVQMRGCEVQHLYRCNTPDGVLWRNDQWSQDEGRFIDVMHEDGETFAAYDVDEQEFVVRDLAEMRDPLSLKKVRQQGKDLVDADWLMHVPPFVEPVLTRISGEVRALDGTVALGDRTFWRTRATYSVEVNSAEFDAMQDHYVDTATVSAG